MRIVTLTTDFGHQDSYVASMKGAILSRNPNLHLVDVSHEVPPQDVLMGQMILEDIQPYFPKGTIHLCVVDPGVGTDRLPILAESMGYYYIGPDNGLFSFLLLYDSSKFYRIRTDLFTKREGATFDGRDVFGPVAAELSKGSPVEDLGEPISSIVDFRIPAATLVGDEIRGEIISIDRFGNLITNVHRGMASEVQGPIEIGDHQITSFTRAYGDVKHSEPIVLWNSAGRLEIAVRNGSAAEKLLARRAQTVICKGVKT